ncbi:MAG: hypothetical protein QM490_05135 [Candidatus Gracilibacteria bacterium]
MIKKARWYDLSDNIDEEKDLSLSDFLQGEEEKNLLSESKFNKKISDISFQKALNDYSVELDNQSQEIIEAQTSINEHQETLSKTQKKLNDQSQEIIEAQTSINEHQETLSKTQKKLNDAIFDIKNHKIELNEQASKLKLVNNLVITLIVALTIVLFGWIYELYWHFDEVKLDYINNTYKLDNKIQLFNKDLEKMKSDLKNDIDRNNERNLNIEKQIEKEIELRLSKKIIELKLNIK